MNKFLLPIILALSLLTPTAAFADIGKGQAVSVAQGVYPGRVLSVKLSQQGETSVYSVKTLSANGDVHIVVVDANSGQVISKR